MIATDFHTLANVARCVSSNGAPNPLDARHPCRPWHLLFDGIRSFWTAPVTPRPLALFRIGIAFVLLTQAFSLIGHLEELFGTQRVVDRPVTWASPLPGVPDLAWVKQALTLVGLPASFGVPFTLAVYVGALIALLFGFRTRWSAGVAWLSHTALITTNSLAMYGVDAFAQIGLFYCVFFPVGQVMSMDQARSAGGRNARGNEPSFGAWLGLRILQIHVCVFYTASGIEKASGEQWWNGEAIWRAVMGAPLDGPPIDCSFLAIVPWLSQGLCWMTLLLEAGIVAFVWHPRLRKLWLVSIIGMHVGIALLMNLWTFSATMIVFDLAAFGFSARSGCSKVGIR